MKLLNERTQIREVAGRWAAMYVYSKTQDNPYTNILGRLKSLDVETATSKDVADIIGSDRWIIPQACGECNKRTWDLVEIGEEPYYESATAWVCIDCLKAALNLFETEGLQK